MEISLDVIESEIPLYPKTMKPHHRFHEKKGEKKSILLFFLFLHSVSIIANSHPAGTVRKHSLRRPRPKLQSKSCYLDDALVTSLK